MKNVPIFILAISLFATPAEATPMIRFSASLDSDELAEETILLLQCISQRSGLSWEFSGEASGTHWLRAQEEARKANITWHSPDGEKTLRLFPGKSADACDEIIPAPKSQEPSALTSELPWKGESQIEEPESTSSTWIWIGLAALGIGGLLYWKSKRPDHSHVQML